MDVAPAVDLAGPITLRPLTGQDLPLLTSWLAEPHVHRWWHHEASPEAVERDFPPTPRAGQMPRDLIASVAGTPVGLVQCYRWHDNPDDVAEIAPFLQIPPGATSIDYLIGRPEHTGHGLGPRIVTAAVALSWRRYPDTPAVIVPVVVTNRASWRALEKAGFRHIGSCELTAENPADPPLSYVLQMDRPHS